MPLYEYRCTQCSYRYEKIQSFNAEPETECPKCHGALMRPLTAPALQFKGAGWYVNDYAAKGGGGSSEDKPAAPAETKTGVADSAAKPAAAEAASKPAATESAAKPAAATPSSSSSE